MAEFRVVAVGGTFDIIHKGHRVLLTRAFERGEKVLIGVTTDSFARQLGKSPIKSFPERLKFLNRYLNQAFPGREYITQPLDDYFGPLFFKEEVEAIVVSDETLTRVELANRLRSERGLEAVKAIVIPLVPAKDGKPISTTRIKQGEIDEEGQIAAQSSKA